MAAANFFAVVLLVWQSPLGSVEIARRYFYDERSLGLLLSHIKESHQGQRHFRKKTSCGVVLCKENYAQSLPERSSGEIFAKDILFYWEKRNVPKCV